MKKLSLFSVIAALLFAVVGFTGCKPEPTPNSESNVKLFQAAYLGSQDGINELDMVFTSGDLVINGGKPSGTGDYVYLSFLAEVDGKLFPKSGTYGFISLSDEASIKNGNCVKGFAFNGKNAGTWLQEINNGEWGEGWFVEDGEVVVEGNSDKATIKMTLKAKDRETKTYTYVGKIPVEDLSEPEVDDDVKWKGEPQSPVENKDVKFSSASYINFGDHYGIGLDVLQIDLKGADYIASFMLYKDINAEVIDGKYTINGKKEPMGGDATSGAMADPADPESVVIMAPYVAVPSGNGVSQVYYIEKGSVTISKDKIEFNVTSHFGHTFKCTYNGTIIEKPKPNSVMQNNSRKMVVR